MPASGSILGNAVLRLEDPALLTGAAKYVDDLVETGTLHVVFVRSTVAHADLRAVNVAETLSMPGVVAVYHSDGDDLGLASLQQFTMMPETLNRPIFATGKVRFVGEVIAAVVAETRAAAVDAAESVVVEYDELPAVTSPVDALASDAPLLFAEHESNMCFSSSFPPEGDVDPLVDADVVAEVTMVSQRLVGRSNGAQRHPGGAGRRRPHVLDLVSGAELVAGGVRRNARAGIRPSCASCARGSGAASVRSRRRMSSTS